MVFETEPALRNIRGLYLHSNPGSKRRHHQRKVVGLGEAIAHEEHTDGLPIHYGNGRYGRSG